MASDPYRTVPPVPLIGTPGSFVPSSNHKKAQKSTRGKKDKKRERGKGKSEKRKRGVVNSFEFLCLLYLFWLLLCLLWLKDALPVWRGG